MSISASSGLPLGPETRKSGIRIIRHARGGDLARGDRDPGQRQWRNAMWLWDGSPDDVADGLLEEDEGGALLELAQAVRAQAREDLERDASGSKEVREDERATIMGG